MSARLGTSDAAPASPISLHESFSDVSFAISARLGAGRFPVGKHAAGPSWPCAALPNANFHRDLRVHGSTKGTRLGGEGPGRRVQGRVPVLASA
jgi:hypothetical protein